MRPVGPCKPHGMTACMCEPREIDRIDARGNIRQHLTLNGANTLCGIPLGLTQVASGNAPCGTCIRLLRSRQAYIAAAAKVKK